MSINIKPFLPLEHPHITYPLRPLQNSNTKESNVKEHKKHETLKNSSPNKAKKNGKTNYIKHLFIF